MAHAFVRAGNAQSLGNRQLRLHAGGQAKTAQKSGLVGTLMFVSMVFVTRKGFVNVNLAGRVWIAMWGFAQRTVAGTEIVSIV